MSEKIVTNDPRVRRTRQMLQQALIHLMAEKSFNDITVQDITSRADVNRATFYAHFDDKYELVNVIIRQHFQAALAEKLPPNPAPNCTNLRLLIHTVYAYLSSFPGQCVGAQLHNNHQLVVQQVQHQLYDVLLDWLKGYPPATAPTTPLEMTAMVTSWAIFGPVLQGTWNHRQAIPFETLADDMMTLIPLILQEYLVDDKTAV